MPTTRPAAGRRRPRRRARARCASRRTTRSAARTACSAWLRTAVYDYEPPEGGTALAVAFDVTARYNVVSDDGEEQLATIEVTDFRMVMAEDRGEWQWDGWDLADVAVSVVPQP